MKDIYSPLEIDEEWDNFAPVESAAPPAEATPVPVLEKQEAPEEFKSLDTMPGTQVVPEAVPKTDYVAKATVDSKGTQPNDAFSAAQNNNQSVDAIKDPEAPAMAVAGGGDLPQGAPSNNIDTNNINKDSDWWKPSETPMSTPNQNEPIKKDEKWWDQSNDKDVIDTSSNLSQDSSKDAGVDMDALKTDPARDAAIEDMAKENKSNPDTLDIKDIGGIDEGLMPNETMSATDNAIPVGKSAEENKAQDMSEPEPVKISVSSEEANDAQENEAPVDDEEEVSIDKAEKSESKLKWDSSKETNNNDEAFDDSDEELGEIAGIVDSLKRKREEIAKSKEDMLADKKELTDKYNEEMHSLEEGISNADKNLAKIEQRIKGLESIK